MPNVTTKGSEFALAFSEREFNELGLEPSHSYRLVRVREGVWVLLDEGIEQPKPTYDPAEKVISLLKQKSFGERVEGRFEKYLNNRELEKFSELLQAGVVEKVKLSPKYRNAIYRLRENNKKESSRPEKTEKKYEEKEKDLDEYSLENDGFTIARDEARVKLLSDELSERIKNNEVKGIKGFDGNFYIMESELYSKKSVAISDFLEKRKTASLNELSEGISSPKMLTKVACEFMKDDGTIIEKRNELYQWVG